MLDSLTPAVTDRPHPFIFNTARYAALHAHRFGGRTLHLADGRGAFYAVETAPGRFTSPGRASFGGFDVYDETQFQPFVQDVEAALCQAGAERWDITLPPLCYQPGRAARDLTQLCRLGYVVTRQELNQWLPVDGRSFLRLGNYANRKRLHRALRLGVTVRLLEPADYGTAYDAVAENRRKKGRTLSMAWEDVQQLAAAFPHQLRMFGAFMAGSMIAAAICLQVRHDILYVYAWGEREGAEAASPVTVLARSIHDFASALGLTMVDLGTSSIDGVVNQGLAAFKRSLGAEASLKLWLHKTARASQPNLTATPAAPCDYSASYDPETDFDRWYTILTARRIEAELRPGQAVLELGSATGLLTSTLAGEGRRIVCVERAAAYVARAHARTLPGVEIRHEDATTFTPEGVFDHVLAINVLHELPDPSPVIRHLRDCLAPSGLLHVTLPNPRSLHRLSALAAGMITTLDAVSERGGAFGTLRLQGADEVASSMAALGLREIRRAGVLVKPLPNAAMASLSDEIIEAYDALAADLPGHGAMTYQVFARA